MAQLRIWVKSMEKKKDIRKRVLEIRNGIGIEEWEEKSHRIQNKVVTHSSFLNADVIYCYIDYRNEVGTKKIIQKAWELEKKVAVPKVEGDEMNFYYISGFCDLKEGYRGIPEPKISHFSNDKNALVIMPGVAFDKQRNRIGYGKGFYDKFMGLHRDYKTIAIAFECQLIDKIETDLFDYRPNVLITEEKIYDE